MPAQKKQAKAKAIASATTSAAVKGKSKTKTKPGSKAGCKAGNLTAATSYSGLISNNGDFGDYFWNEAPSTDQDDISMAVNHDSEDEYGQGGHTAEDNFSGHGGQ